MDIRPHPVKSPIERFMALIKVSTEHFYNGSACWDWLGSKSKDGYGQFILSARRRESRIRIAPYRFIWEHLNGPMPEGLEPDHLCNRRGCCNPAHVEPVTHSENQKRSYQRGRRLSRRARPSHCPRGHEYTIANMMRGGKGPLQCRACNTASTVARRALAPLSV